MQNQITIDLLNINNKENLLLKLGEVFDFGGPDGNIKVVPGVDKGWGMNLDALNDSLACLEDGGIWATGKKSVFPMHVTFINTEQLKNDESEVYEGLVEIFENNSKKYKAEGKDFVAEFK